MTSRLWAVNCVDKELEAFVPGLFMAWAEPGQSEPTYLGSYIVPKTFDTIFMFKERDDKDWLATFTISISDLGTPSLDSVTIRNGVDRWKIKLIEQYRYTLLELALKIVVKTRTPHIMLESEYSLSAVSLARAMAKLGVGNTDPVLMELPTHLKSVPTKFVRYWDGKADPLTVGELKELAKRKKITVKNGISFNGKTYSYVLRVPDPDTGKTKPRWVSGFATEKQAKLERDKARIALATNTYVTVTGITVGQFLDNWIELHATQLKPTTLNKYRSYLRLYLKPGIGSIKLQELKPSHVQTLYGHLLERPLAPSTVHYAGSVLKLALNYAVDVEGLLATNPANKVSTPKGTSVTPDLWNKDELNRFLKVASEHRLGFYFRLSAYTGARRGELCALRWSDFDGSLLTISKSRVRRVMKC
jgi:hypothetical protein